MIIEFIYFFFCEKSQPLQYYPVIEDISKKIFLIQMKYFQLH